MMSIVSNLKRVKEKIESAALRVGRDPKEIKLIVVTKNVAPFQIKEVIAAGVTDIGENRVQELTEKLSLLDSQNVRVNWHFVGHLQRNKAKYIIEHIELIHSVDSFKLAEEIEKRSQQLGKVQQILVQVNLSGEKSKFGFLPQEVKGFLGEIVEFKHISVQGLMTMAPLVAAEKIRPVFARAKNIFEELKDLDYPHAKMQYLSMGMSNDFEVAIEEGSNTVRIGTAIFHKGNKDDRI